jgi:hypothetical protein
MKTIKFFSVLSLVLIFAGVNAVYSGNGLNQTSNKLYKTTIRYQVNIHLASWVNLSNTYLVQVTDEKGRVVAHPQVFNPAIKQYVFNEVVSAPAKVRIASLVLSDDGTNSPISLITKPDVKVGMFYPGQTYSFDLYPIIEKNVIKEENTVNDDPDSGINP